MARRIRDKVPANLQGQLETARLDLLALFRALDQLDLSPKEIPQKKLRDLLELDADFAEALCVLDYPLGSLDVHAMLNDTQASLRRLPALREVFLRGLAPRALSPLASLLAAVRASLAPEEAYHSIPGRDPHSG